MTVDQKWRAVFVLVFVVTAQMNFADFLQGKRINISLRVHREINRGYKDIVHIKQ